MKKKTPLYLLMILTVYLMAFSCKTEISTDEIIVTGQVRLLGSSLFPNLVITDTEEHDWYIEDEDMEKLFDLDQQLVKVRGRPEYIKITAYGEEMGVKRYLRDIRILR